MVILSYMWKKWLKLWELGEFLPYDLDTHHWESKIEIYRTLSHN